MVALKQLKYKHKRALSGFGFISPWLIGFILFFIIPISNSLRMSFSTVSVSGVDLKYAFKGIENFKYAFTGDENFVPYLSEALLNLAIDVPIILICSFFFALILKQDFKGNTIMKVVFFLPVILGNGVFALYQAELMTAQGVTVEAIQSESQAALGDFTSSGLLQFMADAGLPKAVLNYLTIPIERIYDLMSKSGVQTFIFLSALKGVSPSLYEAAYVEGCSAWESFWKITLPMVSPMIIVNVVYSLVDSFAAEDNVLLDYIYDLGFTKTQFGLSAAMSWIFFVILGVIVAFILWIVNKRIVYLNTGR